MERAMFGICKGRRIFSLELEPSKRCDLSVARQISRKKRRESKKAERIPGLGRTFCRRRPKLNADFLRCPPSQRNGGTTHNAAARLSRVASEDAKSNPATNEPSMDFNCILETTGTCTSASKPPRTIPLPTSQATSTCERYVGSC